MGLNAMPSRAEFIQRLTVRLRESERDRICYKDMAQLVAVQRRVLDAIAAVLGELGLEEIRN